MRTREQIDMELESLNTQLSGVTGTPTEVYTRIVGYYRSLTNWNKGKREEYNFRKMFHPQDRRVTEDRGKVPESAGEMFGAGNAETIGRIADYVEKPAIAEVKDMDFYIFFYRNTCPNCPPVKSYIAKLPISGRIVNVDEPEGRALAQEHQVLASPTVLFFDANNNEIYRAHNVQSLKEIARFAGNKRELASV